MTLGEKIQDLRKRNGMSQDTLAERLEVSRQAVSKWERDEAVPEADKLVRIAKLFRVSTDYLLMDEPVQLLAPAQPQSRSGNTFWRQLERFARRHGYKGGFILSGVGALLCAIVLGLRAVVNSMTSSMIGAGNSMMDGMLGGFGGTFEGIPGYGDMMGSFQQSMDQMHGFASNMGNIFLIGLIPGIALVAAGVAVVIIGKKYAKEVK